MNRLRELDFLRGIAIILVLFRHIELFSFTTYMGWIGVDLFFVLSGFLVSGLLFKEYIKFGNIKPKLFLIRRGFKIYPIYFLSYLIYLLPKIVIDKFSWKGLIGDLTFTQNYVTGWGYAYEASWSLAVEEHFYFLLVILLMFGLKFDKNLLSVDAKLQSNKIEKTVGIVLISVLLLRILSNIIYPNEEIRHFTMTHLRIDSLLFGVLISYFYYFKRDFLDRIYSKNTILLAIICLLGLIWTPLIDPVPSFFVKTIGFSLLYISFGILLLVFLLKVNINQTLNTLFSTKAVTVVSKIGYSSYSIYIIHSFVIKACRVVFKEDFNHYVFFIVASTISVIAGMIMTYKIESYFLSLRNKYYPSRV